MHEWSYKVTDGQLDKEKNIQNQEPTEDIITWVFEAGTFVPTAKILNNKQIPLYPIIWVRLSKCMTGKEIQFGIVCWIFMEK